MEYHQLRQNSWLKAFNQILNVREFELLDSNQLVEIAQNTANFNKFGAFFNRDAFEVYVNDINSSKTFHQFGKLAIKHKILHHLVDSLRLQQIMSQHPIKEDLSNVVLITGLWRTGTTYLQRQLANHEDFQSSIGWQMLYPLCQSYKQIKGRVKAFGAVQLFNSINPLFNIAHPVSYHQEEEDMPLFDMGFTSSINDIITDLNEYPDFVEGQNLFEMYKAAKYVHQTHLQQKKKRKWFIIKSPHHMDQIEHMRKLYPELRIIRIIRDEAKSVESLFNLIYHGYRTFHLSADTKKIKDRWLRKTILLSEAYMQTRKQFGTDRFIEIRYDDLINDFGKTMHYIGRKLSVDIDPDFVYIKKKRKILSAKDKLTLQDFHLSEEEVSDLFNHCRVNPPSIDELLAND